MKTNKKLSNWKSAKTAITTNLNKLLSKSLKIEEKYKDFQKSLKRQNDKKIIFENWDLK